MSKKWLLYTEASPVVLRIVPELATEIGLNESIVLLQISFWISSSDNERDGRYWTYQSFRGMKEKAFPYWSIDTIRRAVTNLTEAGYITVGNYNKRKGDNTQWYSIEPEKCSHLKSVLCNEARATGKPYENRTPLYENRTPLYENRTTLPENTPESTHRDIPAARENGLKTSVPKAQIDPMKNAIALAFGWQWETMPDTAQGNIQKTARELCVAGYKPEDVKGIYAYCKAMDFKNFTPLALAKHAEAWRKSYRPAPSPNVIELNPAAPLASDNIEEAFQKWQQQQSA